LKEKLIEYLESNISACQSNARESIQELDSHEAADQYGAMERAYQNVLDFVNSNPA